MRWGKAGSCGARRLIRSGGHVRSLLTLSWEERLESVAEWQQRPCHPPSKGEDGLLSRTAGYSVLLVKLPPSPERTDRWGTGLWTLG